MTDTVANFKRPTRIPGLDEMTHGGLPRSGVTLLAGATGTGKTVLCMQIAARAAEHGEGAVLASFEESPQRLKRSAASFSWSGSLDDPSKVAFIDARLPSTAASSGSFGLEGLMASVAALAETMTNPWFIIDGIDYLLLHQPHPAEAAAQIAELDAWSEEAGVPVIVTGKIGDNVSLNADLLGAFEFIVPTALHLSTVVTGQRVGRRLRIVKYRGSDHVPDEVPLIMDHDGVHLPYGAAVNHVQEPASAERISTGVPQLDRVLGGGLHRPSSVLISGAPGTSKSTLAASIAEAAAERGEKVLMFSYDESRTAIVHNAASVGIDLASHVDAGAIRIEASSAWAGLVEEHFLAIHRAFVEEEPSVLIIDPISALLKVDEESNSYLSIDRIMAIARSRNALVVLTALTAKDHRAELEEGTPSNASTLADTWISLSYRINGAERNRALSVVKSRGSAHSNQVRELVMSDEGLHLVDVFPYGSEVLMGTARLHEEHRQKRLRQRERIEHADRLRTLEAALRDARSRREEAEHDHEKLSSDVERARHEADLLDQADDAMQAAVIERRQPGDADRDGTRWPRPRRRRFDAPEGAPGEGGDA